MLTRLTYSSFFDFDSDSLVNSPYANKILNERKLTLDTMLNKRDIKDLTFIFMIKDEAKNEYFENLYMRIVEELFKDAPQELLVRDIDKYFIRGNVLKIANKIIRENAYKDTNIKDDI